MSVMLRGLPEMDYFPTPEDRERSLRELEAEVSSARNWGYWFGIIVMVVSVWVALRMAKIALRFVDWDLQFEAALRIAFTAICAWLVLRWLHRSGAQGDLRRKLVECGVAVCMKCGYLLRGLPVDTTRCPECGDAIDERVKPLMDRTNPHPPTAQA